jgi:hypothetical protein
MPGSSSSTVAYVPRYMLARDIKHKITKPEFFFVVVLWVVQSHSSVCWTCFYKIKVDGCTALPFIGAPRVGNSTFAQVMSNTCSKQLYQLRNDADFFTMLPTSSILPIMGTLDVYEYIHAGTMYIFHDSQSNLGAAHLLSTYKKYMDPAKLSKVEFYKYLEPVCRG